MFRNYKEFYFYICIGQDYPTQKQLHAIVKPEVNGVAAHWYDLGVQLLDYATGVLDVIKADHPNDANKCCTVMFEKWLMLKPDASWNQLVTALTNLGLNSLAANLRSHLQTGKILLSLHIHHRRQTNSLFKSNLFHMHTLSVYSLDIAVEMYIS